MQQVSDLRVRYAETDAQGIVHHASYPVWFEEGRSDFLRKIGVPYSHWEDLGYFVVVVDLNVRYLKPAHYEDELKVLTTLVRCKKRLIEFDYKVINRQQVVLAHGTTKHLIMTRAGQPCALSDEFFCRLKSKLENV